MPAISMTDSFVVGKIDAKLINASPEYQAKIVNAGGGKIFYKTASDVDTEDTEIAAGASATVEQVVFIISDSRATVYIEHKEAPVYQDITITDDLTVKDALSVTGAATLGGATTIAPTSAPPGVWAGDYAPATATTGTDVAFAEKKLFLTSVFLPANKTITGIGILLGTEGGTTKLVGGLYSSAGKVLAKTSETTEGTVAGTKETIQEIALTSTYAATGPARYFIGVTGNGTTAKFRAIPANTAGKNVFAGEVELAEKNKLADVTAPSTFTGGKGIVAFLH